jgi:hypothetical protein
VCEYRYVRPYIVHMYVRVPAVHVHVPTGQWNDNVPSSTSRHKVSGTSAFMYSVHLYRGKPAHMHVHNTRKVPAWGNNNSIYNHERQICRTPIVSDRTCSLARDMS